MSLKFRLKFSLSKFLKRNFVQKPATEKAVLHALWNYKLDRNYVVMVFCYQNWSDLMWEKNSCDREKLLKFKAEGRVFAKNLRSLNLEQFILTVKGQNNSWFLFF